MQIPCKRQYLSSDIKAIFMCQMYVPRCYRWITGKVIWKWLEKKLLCSGNLRYCRWVEVMNKIRKKKSLVRLLCIFEGALNIRQIEIMICTTCGYVPSWEFVERREINFSGRNWVWSRRMKLNYVYYWHILDVLKGIQKAWFITYLAAMIGHLNVNICTCQIIK